MAGLKNAFQWVADSDVYAERQIYRFNIRDIERLNSTAVYNVHQLPGAMYSFLFC